MQTWGQFQFRNWLFKKKELELRNFWIGIEKFWIGIVQMELSGIAITIAKMELTPCLNLSNDWCFMAILYSNLGVGISEGCFIFDFASLRLEVARPI